VHIIDLVDLLGKDWAIIANMILNFNFVPLLANPTLGAIDPVGALLNVFVANYAREDDFVHVASHRILDQKLVRDLVDTHKHQR